MSKIEMGEDHIPFGGSREHLSHLLGLLGVWLSPSVMHMVFPNCVCSQTPPFRKPTAGNGSQTLTQAALFFPDCICSNLVSRGGPLPRRRGARTLTHAFGGGPTPPATGPHRLPANWEQPFLLSLSTTAPGKVL